MTVVHTDQTAAGGTILVAPHHFPDLDRERAIADEFAMTLIEAPDAESFRAALPVADLVMITPYAKLTAEDFPRMSRCRAVVRYGIVHPPISKISPMFRRERRLALRVV